MTRAEEITEAARIDHARAGERGERIRLLTNMVISALTGHGMQLGDVKKAKRLIFHLLADDIYGHLAIDIPDFEDGQGVPRFVHYSNDPIR